MEVTRNVKESSKLIGSFEEIEGGTLYIVELYSAEGATETLEQKTSRLIERDIEDIMWEERTKAKPSETEETYKNT